MNTADASGEKVLVVGLGDVQAVSGSEGVLACLGLGSCVGISVYDPVAKVSGMAHVVLADSKGQAGDGASKYADVAVPMLLEKIERLGGKASRLQVKIAGGAQMSLAKGLGDAFKIGAANVEAVTESLKKQGIVIKGSDTGGNKGRTLRLALGTGSTTVSSAGAESREL